jgi:inhibitor of cysteine peptidase
VFKVTLDGGFEIQGNITQVDNAQAWLNDPAMLLRSSYPFMGYSQFITRSIYVGNVLYTFSNSRVQLNSLDDLSVLAKIDLN